MGVKPGTIEPKVAVTTTKVQVELDQARPRLSAIPERSASAIRIGRLAPLILAGWVMIDIGLRLGPVDWLNINPFLVASRIPGRYAPFIPNLRLHQEQLVGELALMGNLPPSETRPPLLFSTDPLGFRVTPLPSSPSRVLVFEGDSFTFGAALSDEETFPTELARQLRSGVYNGGRFSGDLEGLVELDWLLARLPASPKTLVYVLLETVDLSLEQPQRYKPVHGAVKDELRYMRRLFSHWRLISPLKISSQRLFKYLSDDRILPNSYKRRVSELYLPNHQRFLVEPRYIERYLNPPSEPAIRETAEYMMWFQRQIQSRGLDLCVVLVPEALSVYGQWLSYADGKKLPQGPDYFGRLELQLRARKISVVNGLNVLRQSAAEDVARARLAYYREDHHWNPVGIQRIAEATAVTLTAHGFTSPVSSETRAR